MPAFRVSGFPNWHPIGLLWCMAPIKLNWLHFAHLLVIFVLLSTATHQPVNCIVLLLRRRKEHMIYAMQAAKIRSILIFFNIPTCEYSFTNRITKIASVQIPGQASPTKRNMKKYFFGDFHSADFWQKLWEYIKLPWKSIVRSRL